MLVRTITEINKFGTEISHLPILIMNQPQRFTFTNLTSTNMTLTNVMSLRGTGGHRNGIAKMILCRKKWRPGW